MTLEDRIKTLLIEHGMWEDQANEVISIAKEHELLKEMTGRWGDDITQYPKPLLAVVWMSVKRIALEWIDVNMPLAFFRLMFADD